MVAYCRHAAD